jgi:alpha-glucoside transport system permease protein
MSAAADQTRTIIEGTPRNAPSPLASASRAPQTLRERLINTFSSSIVSIIVIVLMFIWSVPTFGLFVASFRPASATEGTGWWTGLTLPWHFTIANYQQVLQQQGMGTAFLNSLIIAIPGTILPVAVAAFGAYAFSWMRFPGRDWLFLGIVALLVVPIQMTLIPILTIFTSIGIGGSYLSVWLAHTAYGLPFAVYLLRNFFGALPSDLIESASLDGASHWHTFTRIILPLSVPALASLVIFQFMWVWNDLLVALVYIGGGDHAPMPVTIANLVSSTGVGYPLLTSAAFISMALPLVVFFSLQRYFVRGILAGSVKG